MKETVFRIIMKHLDKNLFGEESLKDLHRYDVFLDKMPTQKEIEEAKKISDKYRASNEEWNFLDYWEVFLTAIEDLGYEIQPIQSTTLDIS